MPKFQPRTGFKAVDQGRYQYRGTGFGLIEPKGEDVDNKSNETVMPFGKYKGNPLSDVPASYLLWVYENTNCRGYLRNYIENNMQGIKKQIQDGNGDV